MPDSSAVGLAEYAFVNATQCYPACELFATPGSSDDAFATCLSTCTTPATIVTMLPSIVFTIFLVMCSGMFSGLTLGLLSLTIEGLDIVINAGSPEEKRWAERILPLRKRGNLLLCTLLLGNTLVNALIAITSAQMTSGVVGGLISTVVIVIFGEICPQAICSRHGLRIGAASVCIVRPLMIVLLPITYPIAMVLDYVLGREMGTQYSRQQLDALLEMEMAQGAVSAEDQQLLSSALRFSSKVSAEIMTPLKDVFMISVTDNLDFDHLKDIYTSGYTRIPVYHNRKDCIVGIVFTKDLILVDPNDEIPVASILPFCSRSLHAAPKGTGLEKLLSEMQASRSHLYFVTDVPGAQVGKKLARVEHVVGIVTMEDLIEELISIEIIDETDTVIDNVSKKKTLTSARRLEFFEMLQRREELLADGTRETGPHFIGGERPAADEVRALASYLSNNVTVFKPPHWSIPMLRRLLLRCSISTITQEDVLQGRYVYVRGVPASFCCLLLHGQLQIRAGNEGFISEIGPWTTLALPALTDAKYTPDFTARVECAARILIISRAEVLAVLGASEKYPSTSPVIQGRESISAPVGERKRDSPLAQRHAFGGGMPSSPSQQAGSLLAGSDARLLPSASEAASLDAQLDEERSLDGGRACDGVSAANGASAAGAGGVSLF